MAPIPAPVVNGNSIEKKGRVINFAAGPSKLPDNVLQKAQEEFMNFNNTGCNVMELSHRGSVFKSIMSEAEQLLRQMLNVPDNYKIIFMQGGGWGQFSAVPLNLLGRTQSGVADYIVTGRWSASAAKEAKNFCEVNYVIPDSADHGSNTCRRIPDQSQWQYSPDPAYVFLCDNETVDGIEFLELPDAPEGVPVVADMSSNLMSRRIDISKFGMVFAGAQKNLGPAGLTIVIIRDDLLSFAAPHCPTILNYDILQKNDSMLNTPPTYSVYITMLVLRWVRDCGGVDKMTQLSQQKSSLIYDFFDRSNGFYLATVSPSCRSRVNIVFRLAGGESMEKKFVEEAAKRGLVNLEGHRSVGGLRASLYNAMSVNETRQLLNFMRDFMSMAKPLASNS